MTGLPDNYFRDLDPADIVTAANSLTLATISTYDVDELTRIGWLNNPMIDLMYGLTAAGIWVFKVNSSGFGYEANSASISTSLDALKRISTLPSVSGYQGVTATVEARVPRSKILTFTTDGAGAAVAQVLHTGPAGYYPVVRIKRVISNVADASSEFVFSVTGGALVGPAQVNLALVAHTINTQMLDLLLYNITDASAINLAINAGPISANVYVEVEYWSET